MINGDTYPAPDELDKIERLFGGMPAEVLFDPELLEYRNNWPPPRGFIKKNTDAEDQILRRRANGGE